MSIHVVENRNRLAKPEASAFQNITGLYESTTQAKYANIPTLVIVK